MKGIQKEYHWGTKTCSVSLNNSRQLDILVNRRNKDIVCSGKGNYFSLEKKADVITQLWRRLRNLSTICHFSRFNKHCFHVLTTPNEAGQSNGLTFRLLIDCYDSWPFCIWSIELQTPWANCYVSALTMEGWLQNPFIHSFIQKIYYLYYIWLKK